MDLLHSPQSNPNFAGSPLNNASMVGPPSSATTAIQQQQQSQVIFQVIEKVIEVAQICEPFLVASVRSPELAHECCSKLPTHERLAGLVFLRDLYKILGESSSTSLMRKQQKLMRIQLASRGSNNNHNNKNEGAAVSPRNIIINNNNSQNLLTPASFAASLIKTPRANATEASRTPRADGGATADDDEGEDTENPPSPPTSPVSTQIVVPTNNNNNTTVPVSQLFTAYRNALCGQLSVPCRPDQDEPFGVPRVVHRGLCHGDTEPLRKLLKISPPLLKFFVQNLLATDPGFNLRSETAVQREFLRELHNVTQNPQYSMIFENGFNSDSDCEQHNNNNNNNNNSSHDGGRLRTLSTNKFMSSSKPIASKTTRITLGKLRDFGRRISSRINKASQREILPGQKEPVITSGNNNNIDSSNNNNNDSAIGSPLVNNNNINIENNNINFDSTTQQISSANNHDYDKNVYQEDPFEYGGDDPILDFLREYPQFAAIRELRVTPRDALFAMNTMWCLTHPLVGTDVHYSPAIPSASTPSLKNYYTQTASILENEGYHLWQETFAFEGFERSVATAQVGAAAAYATEPQHYPHLKKVINDPVVLEAACKLSAERPLEDRIRFLLEINLAMQKRVPEECWRGMLRVVDKTHMTLKKSRPVFEGASLGPDKDKLATSCVEGTDKALHKTPVPTPSLKPWELGVRIGDYLTNVLQEFVFVCDRHGCHEILSGPGDAAKESETMMMMRQLVAVVKWAVREVNRLTDEAEKCAPPKN